MGAILSHSRKWQLQQRSTCGFLSFSPWPLPNLKQKLKLMLKLNHGFCMVTMEATILDTTVTMVLDMDMDMDLYGVAKRGKPKLPLVLMLMLIPTCCMDMASMVATMEDGEDTD